MRESLFETLIGFVVVAIAGFFLAYSLHQREARPDAQSNMFKASFFAANGISVGSDVKLAGATVGRVTDIDIDPKTYRALVSFTLPKTMTYEGASGDLLIPDDSTISIQADGLLGGSHLGIMIGGSEEYYEPGATIFNTRPSVDFLTVLSGLAGGLGGGSSDSEGAPE
jgi:phospholipid/cholesterol/gamma-HCH transport system substrate-binding protein